MAAIAEGLSRVHAERVTVYRDACSTSRLQDLKITLAPQWVTSGRRTCTMTAIPAIRRPERKRVVVDGTEAGPYYSGAHTVADERAVTGNL